MINNYRAFRAIERSAPPSFSCRRVNEGSINKMEDNRGKFFVLNCIFFGNEETGWVINYWKYMSNSSARKIF